MFRITTTEDATGRYHYGIVINVNTGTVAYITAGYCTAQDARHIACVLTYDKAEKARAINTEAVVNPDYTTPAFADEWRSRTWK